MAATTVLLTCQALNPLSSWQAEMPHHIYKLLANLLAGQGSMSQQRRACPPPTLLPGLAAGTSRVPGLLQSAQAAHTAHTAAHGDEQQRGWKSCMLVTQ
jgi:hypothetical protein